MRYFAKNGHYLPVVWVAAFLLTLGLALGVAESKVILGVEIGAEQAAANIPLAPASNPDRDYGAVALMYHHIVTDEDFATGKYAGNNAVIALSQFEEEMAYLAAHKYHTYTMSEAAAMLYNSLPFPDKSVMITFDDGYASNYELAFPILQEYNLKATIAAVVISTEQAENGGAAKQPLPHLTFEQLREMQASGLVEIGSHSYNGHGLIPTGANGSTGKFFVTKKYMAEQGRRETEAEFAERITQDLRHSKEVLESELGRPIYYFAYPYGAVSSGAVDALKNSGFLVAITTNSGDIYKNSDPLKLNRRNVDQGVSLEKFASLLK